MFARFTRREKITISIYLSLFAFLIFIVGFSARHVIFKPWTARSWISAVEVSGKVYIFGGLGMRNRVYDEILMIDLNTMKLIHAGNLPSPRFAAEAVYYDGSVYIIGGFDGKRYFNDVVRFDLTSRKAETVFRLEQPRCFGSLVRVDRANNSSMLYYLGGWNGKNYLDTILEIDPKQKTSRIVGKLPCSLEHLSACSTGEGILVIGGEGKDMNYRRDMVELETDFWRVTGEGKLDSPRIRSACIFTHGRAICVGGWNGRELRDVIAIEPKEKGKLYVKRIATLPRGMADIAVVEYEGNLYIVGGTSSKSNRQIGLLSVNMDTGESSDIVLKSYSWR